MKIFATGAIALSAAMISAAPAAAQYGGGYGQSAPPPPPTVPSIPNTMPQPQASEQPSLKISKEAMKAIVELQKAVTANDFANVPAKAQAALAVAKTKEDRYAIAQLQLKAAVTASDDAGAAAAIDAIAGTQYLAADKVADLYSAVGVNFYKAKKFDEAAAQFQKSAALAPQNAKPLTLLAEARRAQGRGADASAALQKAMQLSRAAGQTPEEDLFKTAVSLAYEGVPPMRSRRPSVGRRLSEPDSWRNALAIYRNMTHPDVEATLDILRLMNATGAMTEANDYELYSTAAAEQGNYVEALAVLNNGVAAKRIDPAGSQFRDLVARSESQAPGDRGGSCRSGEDGARREDADRDRRPLLRARQLRQGGRDLPRGARQARRQRRHRQSPHRNGAGPRGRQGRRRRRARQGRRLVGRRRQILAALRPGSVA